MRKKVFSEEVGALTFSVAFGIELGLEMDAPLQKIHI